MHISNDSTNYDPRPDSILTDDLLKPLGATNSLLNEEESSLKYSFEPSSLLYKPGTTIPTPKANAPPNSYNNSLEISPLHSPVLISPHLIRSFSPSQLSPL